MRGSVAAVATAAAGILAVATIARTSSIPHDWNPPDPRLRPIFHPPASNIPGYIGDANGMMFHRSTPFSTLATKDVHGIYHLFFEYVPRFDEDLYWGHAISHDYVTWAVLPEVLGDGAEAGGVAQLDNGEVVAIFNVIGKGHMAASPVDYKADPLLKNWSFTKPVVGISGTDLMGGFKDGSGDGLWRIVADGHQMSGDFSEVRMFKSKDLIDWMPQGNESESLHRWKWTRCMDLKEQCGGHPYPCDPGMFQIPNTDVWVIYGMLKTCADSGREFYALGSYNVTSHSFSLLDELSDMGNNLFDGGDGYASMTLLDPLHGSGSGRRIWTAAVIEGDRDPSDPRCGFGGTSPWTGYRGWFGTLSLPRVIELGNHTLDDGSLDLYLVTPPLPELSSLRLPANVHSSLMDLELKAGNVTSAEPVPIGLRSTSLEVNATFELPPASADGSGWDLGLQLLWSDDDVELTRTGIRDGTVMPGVDLWDEVNGDSLVKNDTTSADACRKSCEAESRKNVSACGAWTFTPPSRCRFKAFAHRSLQVVSNANCFLPNFVGSNAAASTSGFIQQKGLRFAQLYVDRARSWVVNASCDWGDCHYGHFPFAQTLRLLPDDNGLSLHAFVDKSIVEIFGQAGRAVVTARVYPTLTSSNKIGVYNAGPAAWRLRSLAAWELKHANTSAEDVLHAGNIWSDGIHYEEAHIWV